MYGEFTLAGLFNMGGTEAFYNPCKANQTCGHSPPVGGGLGMRLGYNFDPIGIEIAGFGMGDYRSEAVKGTGPAPSTDFVIDEASGVKRNEDFYVVGYHGFFGGGLRLLWGGVLGVTVGVTPGVVFRNYVIGRTVDLTAINQGPVVTTDKASASSFALLGDVGLVIGRKLVLGALLSYDTADNIRSAGGNPTAPQGTGQLSNVGANLPGGVTGAVLPSVKVTQPQYKITSSGQLFVGPVLTFHF
jgi:hypothetical protein